jgi:hypothetical protein
VLLRKLILKLSFYYLISLNLVFKITIQKKGRNKKKKTLNTIR